MHPSAGCLPCKSRKKKCDVAKPICRGCERNYLICVWPSEQRKPSSRGGIPSSALSMFALETGTPSTQHGTDKEKNKPASRQRRVRRSPLIPAPSVSGALSPIGPLKPESKFLLDHYLHRTGKMASAHVGHYTPFTDALLPIAHNSSPVLLDSILAFSSFHLMTSGSNFSSVNTLEHHALALRSLKYGLTKYSRGDKEMGIQLFLSMLMLCCVELANGQCESSFHHLTALRSLAPDILGRSAAMPDAYKPAMVFGRELYAYFLALSCICTPDDAADPTVVQESSFVFSEIAEYGYTGALFGCSDALFSLAPEAVSFLKASRRLQMTHLASRSEETVSQTESGAVKEAGCLLSEIALLLTKVSLWEPDELSDITFAMSGRILQLALTILLVEASYWCTVVTSAHRGEKVQAPVSFRTQSRPNLQIQTSPLVAEFVAFLAKLPAQSWIATTMCWSVVVLGSYATLPSDRATIQQYLQTMEATFGFRNMTRARVLLEHIWSRVRTFETDQPIAISEAMVRTGGRFLLG